ncbi:MAG: DUF1501 domain-containing protein [Planctomycetes bacterium]|nr:DUF1501 domain-containing protein [Planctomycetota bacterium]
MLNPGEADQGSGDQTETKHPKAKSVILFFLCGGASHIDTWDMKPEAPLEYRGPFQSIATSAPGVRLCEHLPLVAQQSHHLAIIRSVGASVSTNDHHAGYYYNLTGHVPDPTFLSLGNDRRPYPDDWPFMGCVVGSRVQPRSDLPNVVTLPHKPSKAPYTRPGQFAAKLGVEYDPLYVDGSLETPLQFQAPSLALTGDTTASQLQSRTELLQRMNRAQRDLDRAARQSHWTKQQERSMQLLLSAGTTKAFDLASESEAVRDSYGSTVNAMSLLLARRLVEAGVPFVTIFWKENEKIADACKSEGAWDTHGNNFECLKKHLLPEFDRAFAALLGDLHRRGLLDQTLVMVTSEMGRKPKIGDPRSGGTSGAGRDHWTHCQSVLMAGGGIRGGQTYGTTDRYAEYPADNPVTPADIAKTVYHAVGVENLQATDSQGRPYQLLDEGKPILPLFA